MSHHGTNKFIKHQQIQQQAAIKDATSKLPDADNPVSSSAGIYTTHNKDILRAISGNMVINTKIQHDNMIRCPHCGHIIPERNTLQHIKTCAASRGVIVPVNNGAHVIKLTT